MKKVYRIYRVVPLKVNGKPDMFDNILERHGVRDYQSYEEAEGVVIGNEIQDATILAVYVNS